MESISHKRVGKSEEDRGLVELLLRGTQWGTSFPVSLARDSWGHSGKGGDGDMVTMGFMAVAGVMVAVTVKLAESGLGSQVIQESLQQSRKTRRPEDHLGLEGQRRADAQGSLASQYSLWVSARPSERSCLKKLGKESQRKAPMLTFVFQLCKYISTHTHRGTHIIHTLVNEFTCIYTYTLTHAHTHTRTHPTHTCA